MLSFDKKWKREEKKEKEGSTMPRGHCAELTRSILFPGILDKNREIIQWYYCELFLLELVNVLMLINLIVFPFKFWCFCAVGFYFVVPPVHFSVTCYFPSGLWFIASYKKLIVEFPIVRYLIHCNICCQVGVIVHSMFMCSL